MSKAKKFDELLEQALQNAVEDRKLALDAYDSMKPIFGNIDTTNVETLQAVLLVGNNAVKLLEQCSRSNEQVIKCAQLKEKEKRNKEEEDEETMKFTLEDIKKVASANE